MNNIQQLIKKQQPSSTKKGITQLSCKCRNKMGIAG